MNHSFTEALYVRKGSSGNIARGTFCLTPLFLPAYWKIASFDKRLTERPWVSIMTYNTKRKGWVQCYSVSSALITAPDNLIHQNIVRSLKTWKYEDNRQQIFYSKSLVWGLVFVFSNKQRFDFGGGQCFVCRLFVKWWRWFCIKRGLIVRIWWSVRTAFRIPLLTNMYLFKSRGRAGFCTVPLFFVCWKETQKWMTIKI